MATAKVVEKFLSRALTSLFRATSGRNPVCLARPSTVAQLCAARSIFEGKGAKELSSFGQRIPGVDQDVRCEHQLHALKSSPSSSPLVLSTQLDPHSRMLRIRWTRGEETLYPYTWLRDCCQCTSCFHQGTMSRLVQFPEINFNDMPVSVEANCESQELAVTWSDEHRSVFGYKWLLLHGFGTDGQSRTARWTGQMSRLWNCEFPNRLLTIDFHKLLKDDLVLYDWLTSMEEDGLTLLTNAPKVEGQLEKIAARVAFVRMTCFGPTMFVRNKDYRGNVAYTSAKLEMHNDLVYYNYIPGVKMVHCIQEQTLGERSRSLFVDGFLVAREMKQRFPDQFNLLTSVKLDFCGFGNDYLDYHLQSRHATIKMDEAENVLQVVYNSRARHSLLSLELEEVEPFYQALRTFAEMLNSPKNVVEINLRAGNIVCLNNWRVLHGRTPCEVIPGSEAVLQRGYMDWDEMSSRRRVLQEELGTPNCKH